LPPNIRHACRLLFQFHHSRLYPALACQPAGVSIIAPISGKFIGIGRRSARCQFLRKSFMSHVVENRHLLTPQEIQWTRCPERRQHRLVQKLMLEYSEDEFLKIANRHAAQVEKQAMDLQGATMILALQMALRALD
jgi:hypothetical protein